jgi:hypothetical protein
MIDDEDLSDTAELELIPTAELQQLLEPSDCQDDDGPQTDNDDNRGFDPYNRV